MSRLPRLLPVAVIGLLAAGCATDPYGNPAPGTNTAVGAATGAVAGGVLGNAISSRGNRTAGTIGGAAVGGIVGGLIGASTERPAAPVYAPAPTYYAPPVAGSPYGK